MRSLCRSLTMLLVLPLAAHAQMPAPNGIPPLVRDYMAIQGLAAYELATLPPKDIASAAFGTDYGRALVAELGEILADSADKTCGQAKNLTRADFARRAGEIYERYATRMIEISRSALNVHAYEAALRTRAPSLHADVARLRGDPDVQKLIALERPTRFSDIADRVVENLTGYLLLRRIRLTKEISGLARGDTSLSDRYVSEDAIEARYQFVAKSRSPQLKRYIGLLKTMAEARGAGLDERAILKFGPLQFFAGADVELAELCVLSAKRP